LERFLSALGKAGPSRLIAALGVTGLVAAALFAIMFKVGTEEKALLYSGLNPKDGAAITESLSQKKIKFEVADDGATIYVPRSKVAEARMDLATNGLPGSGNIGYEIFDKQDAMGQTSFVQNINKLRALEGELARSIDSLDTVDNSRVHLVIPEKQLFETTQDPPTASIVVGLQRGNLSDNQISAIRNLVASSVKGLTPDKITILDERGELLASAQTTGEAQASAMDNQKAQYEERMRKRIQDMVEGLVGIGGARVQVSADMDFSQINETEESFDPDKVVARSTRTIEENGAEKSADSSVTQGQNVPDGTNAQAGAGNSSNTNRTDETVNNEISKTTKTTIQNPGKITRLSVAVAVDGVTTPAAKAGEEPKWAPRSEEEIGRITALVRSAAGISDERGDKIEVANVRFARATLDAGAGAPKKFDFDKNDIMRASEILVLALIALAMIFFVARPMIKGIFQDDGIIGMGGNLVMAGANGLPVSGGGVSIDGLPSNGIEASSETVDIARIQGAVNANAMKQVSEVVSENPEQTVAVIRSWLQERRN
jgi:flagellar M-ring protein FliF